MVMRKLLSFFSNLKTIFIRALATVVLPNLVILNNQKDDLKQRFSTWGTQPVSQRVRKII
jgi:hypothetical protein